MSHAFGQTSQFYKLYRVSPTRARKLLWEAYLEEGCLIKPTARRIGCSPNTVRALVRRVKAGQPWENHSSRPRKTGSKAQRRSETAQIQVVARSLWSGVTDELGASTAVLLIKK